MIYNIILLTYISNSVIGISALILHSFLAVPFASQALPRFITTMRQSDCLYIFYCFLSLQLVAVYLYLGIFRLSQVPYLSFQYLATALDLDRAVLNSPSSLKTVQPFRLLKRLASVTMISISRLNTFRVAPCGLIFPFLQLRPHCCLCKREVPYSPDG